MCRFPHCLFMLELLQSEHFRQAIALPQVAVSAEGIAGGGNSWEGGTYCSIVLGDGAHLAVSLSCAPGQAGQQAGNI
jgi:hypothetical protein